MSAVERDAWFEAQSGGPDIEDNSVKTPGELDTKEYPSCSDYAGRQLYGSVEEKFPLRLAIGALQSSAMGVADNHPEVVEARSAASECWKEKVPQVQRQRLLDDIGSLTKGQPAPAGILHRSAD